MQSSLKFLYYASGIFFCYFYYGILQEKITRGKYGEGEGETFTCTLTFVLVQCICNGIFAKVMLLMKPQEAESTRTIYYFSSAMTYLLGMVCSNMALQWVNYPTQVVGKSAKPIPVMLLGVLIGHKHYSMRRYLFVLLIVIGVVTFMYKESASASHRGFEIGIGELLLFLSLFMDGLTGAVQDRMRAESSPTALFMMLNTNYWSSIILGVVVVLSGELGTFATFVYAHPVIIWHMATLAVAGALGQLFIFLMVANFGPLACSVVTTTRKFFTVLTSVLIFGNVILPRQWLGAILVFTGLFLDMFYGHKKHSVKS